MQSFAQCLRKRKYAPFGLALLLWPVTGFPGAAQADEEILDLLGVGIRQLPGTGEGIVSRPELLQRHGLDAQKGDSVKIEKLGGNRFRIILKPTGKSTLLQVPAR